ncbi:hypothetical protein ALC60_09570 [Trachymyrmex zeteki]|uniref:Uncharacterized protein n=1 Tax=Mycetomoellerius zeteki TaxID=64791 RepID=A0A151WTP7_9HYME|nr:PREDICTED: uncharacterized protein LOC108726328 [Trachymyrmex zeteki]KYQ51279.1 hypothetical protein ALC60_09570 [Trachymyrmex zeteki]
MFEIFTIQAFKMKYVACGSAFRNGYGCRRIYRSTLHDLQRLSMVRLVNDLSHTPYSPHYYQPRLTPFSRSCSYNAEGIKEKERMSLPRENNPAFLLYVLPKSLPPAIR